MPRLQKRLLMKMVKSTERTFSSLQLIQSCWTLGKLWGKAHCFKDRRKLRLTRSLMKESLLLSRYKDHPEAYISKFLSSWLVVILQRRSGGLLCCTSNADDVISLSLDMVSNWSSLFTLLPNIITHRTECTRLKKLLRSLIWMVMDILAGRSLVRYRFSKSEGNRRANVYKAHT